MNRTPKIGRFERFSHVLDAVRGGRSVRLVREKGAGAGFWSSPAVVFGFVPNEVLQSTSALAAEEVARHGY